MSLKGRRRPASALGLHSGTRSPSGGTALLEEMVASSNGPGSQQRPQSAFPRAASIRGLPSPASKTAGQSQSTDISRIQDILDKYGPVNPPKKTTKSVSTHRDPKKSSLSDATDSNHFNLDIHALDNQKPGNHAAESMKNSSTVLSQQQWGSFKANPYTKALANSSLVKVSEEESKSSRMSVEDYIHAATTKSSKIRSHSLKGQTVAHAGSRPAQKSRQRKQVIDGKSSTGIGVSNFASRHQWTLDAQGNIIHKQDKDSNQAAKHLLQNSKLMKAALRNLNSQASKVTEELHSGPRSPRPSFPLENAREMFDTGSMEQAVADSEFLLEQLESKTREQNVVADEFEVLLRTLVDNWNVSTKSSSSQYNEDDFKKEEEAPAQKQATGKLDIDDDKPAFDYSGGVGAPPDAPKYLQCKNKVRVRNLSKRDTEMLVKDIWKKKLAEDKVRISKGMGRQEIHEFIFSYMQKRFGNFQHVIAEWGYSMMVGVQAHNADADIEMFELILKGELDEQVYHDQIELCDRVFAAFQKADTDENHGKVTG